MPGDAPRAERTDYSLVDTGDLRKLEHFGPVLLDRPAMTAIHSKRDPEAWRRPTYRFEPERGWLATSGDVVADPAETPFEVGPWPVVIDALRLEVRLTESGGVGLYPEHAANIGWLEDRIRGRVAEDRPPAVLNLFAHTGLLTLAAARAGASVAHVDGARTAVAWARRNAELSGLADRPIRWLVDDAMAFAAREGRRGRRYDGLVIDPPTFGHANGRQWRLADELRNLLARCGAVTAEDAFVLMTTHTAGLDGKELAELVAAAFGSASRPSVSQLRLEAESGAALDLGWSVRLTR